MFQDKVIIVTGGSAGIGKAILEKLAKEKAKVVFCSRGKEEGTRLEVELREKGLEVRFVPCDVKKSEEVQNLIQKTLEYYGGLDMAVNNAGLGGVSKRLAEYPEEIWDKVMNVNLKGIFLCMKYQIPEMLKKGKGSIVNISSIAGLVGADWRVAPYAASKHGVIGLTKSAALEFAHKGIRVNAICPAFTETEMLEGLFQASPDPNAARTELGNKHALKRLASASEVADASAFLLSDRASFITGVALPVDGAYTAK
ncbi:MAG: glucose 1-dehydrogenase [Leptospiraceae bacterium]|nr:glucose 1-dehydrogenase [Leptospiraceae bacterium]MCP5502996.1 glucose 1-dehydrogenase [Leptospiraceae bacterium]